MAGRIMVGLIADTHSLLRPEAVSLLGGSDLIVHAGDVGTPDVLAALARVAPVTAVRGNVDRGAWAEALPETEVLPAGGLLIYVLHRIEDLMLDPAAAGFACVIVGHSHRARIWRKDDVLYVNPGSAGPRRFSLPLTVGRLVIENGHASAELTEFGPAAAGVDGVAGV